MYGFKAPNKLLKKYHQKRLQDIHHRKMANIRSTIDNKAPKTYPHLIVKLKQIQLEEERQAEVDHENKVLLHKMTNIMKNKPSIDYWNEYEPKSLNFVARERHLREIQMENIGIARRLEKAKPVYDLDHFENEYQHKKYLQTLWNDNIKDYDTITPRHLKYREMRKQMGSSYGEYDDMDSLDNDSGHIVLRSDKLPPLGDSKSKQSVKLPPGERATKGDSQVDKLPKIDQSKQRGKVRKHHLLINKTVKEKKRKPKSKILSHEFGNIEEDKKPASRYDKNNNKVCSIEHEQTSENTSEIKTSNEPESINKLMGGQNLEEHEIPPIESSNQSKNTLQNSDSLDTKYKNLSVKNGSNGERNRRKFLRLTPVVTQGQEKSVRTSSIDREKERDWNDRESSNLSYIEGHHHFRSRVLGDESTRDSTVSRINENGQRSKGHSNGANSEHGHSSDQNWHKNFNTNTSENEVKHDKVSSNIPETDKNIKMKESVPNGAVPTQAVETVVEIHTTKSYASVPEVSRSVNHHRKHHKENGVIHRNNTNTNVIHHDNSENIENIGSESNTEKGHGSLTKRPESDNKEYIEEQIGHTLSLQNTNQTSLNVIGYKEENNNIKGSHGHFEKQTDSKSDDMEEKTVQVGTNSSGSDVNGTAHNTGNSHENKMTSDDIMVLSGNKDKEESVRKSENDTDIIYPASAKNDENENIILPHEKRDNIHENIHDNPDDQNGQKSTTTNETIKKIHNNKESLSTKFEVTAVVESNEINNEKISEEDVKSVSRETKNFKEKNAGNETRPDIEGQTVRSNTESKTEENKTRDTSASDIEGKTKRHDLPSGKEGKMTRNKTPSEKDVKMARQNTPSEKDVKISRHNAHSEKDVKISRHNAHSEKDVKMARQNTPSEKDVKMARHNTPSEKEKKTATHKTPLVKEGKTSKHNTPSEKEGKMTMYKAVPDKKHNGESNKEGSTTRHKTEDGSSQGDHSHDRPKDTQLDQDCVALFKAAKQMAKPEEIFIKHLVRRSQKQRQQIRHRFPQLYDLNLVQELKQGLGKDWYLIIDGLLGDKSGSDCQALHAALEKKDYSTAVEVLYFCDNSALTEMNNCYKKEYAVSIESDINEKTEEPEKSLLLLLQRANKEESTSVDNKAAEADGEDLHESGDGRWTSDTGKFLMLLSTKSYSHMKAVLNTYKVLGGGSDITDDIKAECPKKYAETLCTLVTCMRTPENHFADKLYKHHQATDPVLINVLLSRSEIDMTAIKRAYKKRYDADFIEDLRYKNKHPTTDVLVELTNRSAPMQSKGKIIQQKRYGGGVVSSPTRKQPVKRPENKATTSEKNNNNNNPLSQPSQRVMADATQEKKEQEKVKTKEKQEKQEQLMQRKNISGTVKPAPNFSADRDSERLHKAMDGFGTDENVIIEIIPHRSNNQRQQIKIRYQEKYKKELISDLESELTGDCEEIVLGLMMTPIEYDVHCLHEAIDGLGTNEATLIGILVTRNAKEKKAIQEQYKKLYKSDLEKDIISDTSGDFQNMLVALSKGERDQGTTVNQKEAQQDAKMLHRDGRNAVDIKDETFINIMVKKNHAQVKATFKEYEKIAGHDIFTGIANAMLGDAEDGYVALAKAIQDPLEFYADRLKTCFGGLGTNDNMLIRICVSRSEIDLGDIMKCYQKLCNTTLAQSIQKECSGDYKRLLLAVIGADDQ